MKNFWKLFGIITLVVMAGFMISCGSDSDNNNDGSDLVNKWYLYQYQADAGGDAGLYCEFKSNGDYYNYSYNLSSPIGKYTVNGNSITIVSSGLTILIANFSISGTVLNITNAVNPSGPTVYLANGNHYKKQ